MCPLDLTAFSISAHLAFMSLRDKPPLVSSIVGGSLILVLVFVAVLVLI